AGSIVHETAHARLAPLLSLGPLLLGDDASTHRSPWRSDPRSLHGLLNGVHAFTNVCTFYRRLMERDGLAPAVRNQAEKAFAGEVARVDEAWHYLEHHGEPTAFGRPVMQALAEAVHDLRQTGARRASRPTRAPTALRTS